MKHSLDHPALLPEGVILDPDLLATLPLYHKKACALDALCQGIESYWARKATEDSQVDAFLAFTGVLDNLRPYLAGDPHAAEELQYAAYRSGCAIAVSRTTAAHAMSYRLTKRYGLAHGHACMLTLPAIWEAMLDDTDALPVLMDLAQKMRLGSELMGPRLLRGILYDLEMPFPARPGRGSPRRPDPFGECAASEQQSPHFHRRRNSRHLPPLHDAPARSGKTGLP